MTILFLCVFLIVVKPCKGCTCKFCVISTPGAQWSGVFVDFRLQGIVADLENKLDNQTAEHARSAVAHDLELEALKQQEEKMRLEIVQIKETTDRLILLAERFDQLSLPVHNHPSLKWKNGFFLN